MVSNDGRYILSFNGEIYNFRAIRQDLEKAGYTFRSNSDTEVLIKLIEKYRGNVEKFLGRLNGIFAFSVWDVSKKELTLVRDAFGVKPLYYYSGADFFCFSSEIKSIAKSVVEFSVSDLDIEALKKYVNFLWCPGNGTPLNNLKCLEPGHLLKVSGSGANTSQKRRWKSLSLPEQLSTPDCVILERTHDLLRNAVSSQLVSDAPVGGLLSGGVDSSLIAAIAKDSDYSSLMQFYTVAVKGSANHEQQSDLKYARRVAKHLNLSLCEVEIEPCDLCEHIEEMVFDLDEPLADPACLNVSFLAKAASKDGIKVLLSGAGGDDVFSGYRRHVAEHAMQSRLGNVASLLSNFVSDSQLARLKHPSLRRLKKFLRAAKKPQCDRIFDYFSWGDGLDVESLFNSSPSMQGKSQLFEPFRGFYNDIPEGQSELNKLLLLEQRFFVGDHNMIYNDKMSMKFGVELRVPLLDQELVEFINSLPSKYKIKGNTTKWLLKKTLERYVPKEIVYRSKVGFGVPIRSWIQKDLREMRDKYLSRSALNKSGVFNQAKVQWLLDENDNGHLDGAYTIFAILCIQIWITKFIGEKN
jgi:asparagine synthase (glutamine-hydrolysing)